MVNRTYLSEIVRECFNLFVAREFYLKKITLFIMSSSEEDETVLQLCKELKIKPKKINGNKSSKIFIAPNLENIDINNLPLEIYKEPLEVSANSNACEIILLSIEKENPKTLEVIEQQVLDSLDTQFTEDIQTEEIIKDSAKDVQHKQTENVLEIDQENIQSEKQIEIQETRTTIEETEVTEEYYGDLGAKRKRKSRGLKLKAGKEWSKNKCKKLRQEGKEYLGYRRDCKEKKFKVLHDTLRPARVRGPRCISAYCRKSKLRACDSLAEEELGNIFKLFWEEMEWAQRQQYVVSHIEFGNKKQVKQTDQSRRNVSKQYFLTIENQNRVQVCMKTFLNTLGITENTVRYWLGQSEKGMSKKSDITRKISTKGRSKELDVILLKEFLNNLPKMPSHYCRASSTRLYLEPIIQNKLQLFNLYCEFCKEQQTQHVSRWLFDQVFIELNLSIFLPKKDQCDVCCSFKVGNINAVEYNEHIIKKDRARQEKNTDKLRAINKEVHVFTHDLQSVQLCPKLEASAIYYKTKLCVHNFTMYNLENKDVHCYWFDESNAGLVASVYTSCIIDCLKKTLDNNVLPIILYSDGCTAQNRNAVLSNALLELAMDYNVQIQQKILEKGHTQMEVDSVHSAIECQLKNKDIYLPSQYGTYSKLARTKQPYIVNTLSYDFFYDFTKNIMYESIRPGRFPNDPVVTNIRVLLYEPEGIIKFKLNFDDPFSLLPRRPKTRSYLPKPKLYNNRLPITQIKWTHLQELKHVIPCDTHSYYDNLPHK